MSASFHRLNAPERVLVTKIGLDGHDRGSRVVANYLREAGMEVTYTAPWQTIEAVVELAGRGEADVIGVSSLATDHLIVPDLMAALRAAGLDHVAVIVGGIVPKPERALLLEAGVAAIFGPGAAREEIVDTVRRAAAEARHSVFARDEIRQGGFPAPPPTPPPRPTTDHAPMIPGVPSVVGRGGGVGGGARPKDAKRLLEQAQNTSEPAEGEAP
ncbi:MAG: cobalamin B12-binding domain-containing protein [Proteobacteria bacterium]|nr:cobalamin B12-binding domain-containing protein [Pseudomonadota bacterium]